MVGGSAAVTSIFRVGSIYPSSSIYLSSYLSICLSICMHVCLSIYLSIYLSIHLSIYRSICLTTYIPSDISLYPSIDPLILAMCMRVYNTYINIEKKEERDRDRERESASKRASGGRDSHCLCVLSFKAL